MFFHRTVSMAFVFLPLWLLPGTGRAEEQATGLIFTPEEQLASIPLASSPYAGAELPSAVDLSDRMPPPGNQGHQESCVAWAIAYALKSYQENVELRWGFGSPDHVFSPSFIYNQINNGVDGGSRFTDALNLLSSEGVPPYSAMPYSDQDFLSQPSEAARAAAKKYRIDTWRRVNPQDIREVKAQLNAGYPVVIGITVDDGLIGLRIGTIWKSVIGAHGAGHAMLVVGYDDSKNAFKFLNSWGTRWGEGGYAWIDYTFFRTAVHEAFVAKDAADTAEPPPTTAPVGPYPQPPPVASNASFAVTGVEHNVMAFGLIGMRFSGTLDVPDKISGELQVVIHVVSQNGGANKPVMSLIPAYATSDGETAAGTEMLKLQGSPVHTTWSAFLPYTTLSVPHGVRTTLAAVPRLYINRFGVRDGQPIQFFVLLADHADQFFFNYNGKPAGPLSLTEIGGDIEAGAVTAETLVWKAGTPNWVAAKDVPEIASLLPGPAPPIPYDGPGKLLLGTWETEAAAPEGSTAPAKLKVSLAGDGSLGGIYEYTPAGGAATNVPVSGRWAVEAVNDKRINLTLDFVVDVNGEPRATDSTVALDIVDNDTLRNAADGTLTKRVGG